MAPHIQFFTLRGMLSILPGTVSRMSLKSEISIGILIREILF